MSTDSRRCSSARLPGARASCLAFAGLLAGLGSFPATGAEPPPAPVEAQAAQRLGESERLVDRLLGDPASPVRRLDPAIFTELSPVSASEPAVRLPEDQQDGD